MRHIAKIWLVCAAFVAGFVVATAAGAEDWQGRRLPDIPANFIMGYGSLINTPSRNTTAGATVPAIPVRVLASFGYLRAWNSRAEGFTAMGLRKAKAGESGVSINGVLYPATDAELHDYDDREKRYHRVKVPLAQIEAVGWQRLPEVGELWIYVPRDPGAPGGPAPDNDEPDPDHPLLQSYIDVVVEGGLEYSRDFAREILDTTDGWSRFWLNDREMARRPRSTVDPKAVDVDSILNSVAKSAAFFSSRSFPETYAQHARQGAAP